MPRPILNFTDLIESGDISNLTLTIYFAKPHIVTPIAWSVDMLTGPIDDPLINRIVIGHQYLAEHVDLLKQLDSVPLTPIERETRIHAILHYVFEAGGREFTVSGWGMYYNSLFVNGVEVKETSIFYEILLPFVPLHEVERFEGSINRIEMEQ